MRDANHPIWRILQTAVYMAATAGFLWLNADSFDHTEITTLCELAVVIISLETVSSKMKGGEVMSDDIPEQTLQSILDYLKCPNCGKCEQHQVDLTRCAGCGVMCCDDCITFRGPACDPPNGDFFCDECHKQNGQVRSDEVL